MRGGPQQVNTVRRAGPGKMATVKRGWWEEDEALACHRMLSLHQMFELVGSQLSQADVEALTFLLDEAYPLRQAAWAAAGRKDEEEEEEKAENSAWDTIRLHRPKSGERLLYELERRGLCDEANFGNLLQLLRVITRHDLLSYVCQKRGRAVSPERCTYGRPASGIGNQMESCLNSGHTDSARRSWESAAPSSKQHSVGRRKGRAAGKRRGRRSKCPSNREVTKQAPLLQKATCDIRLRVRAVFSDQRSVLRGNVVSVKQDPLDRCFDLFGQANTILKSRDLGSIICDIKFSELSYLDAFWNDYINGSLLEALKGVFITDSLKQAVGQEVIRLLVNVDEDDYEEGRRILLQNISP